MASKTRAFLKNDNKDFDNILDSYLSLSETSAETVAGGITAASSATLGFKKGAMLVSCYPDAAQEAKAGAGACSVTSFYTAITTDGADAMTLAAGTELGQLKKIQLIGDSGDATLTIADAVSNSLDVITMADVGDFVLCIWNGTAWRVLELGNDADGATAPGIA
tara:strand:+ start:138 stop:629 length:492 start_codon:yes stop_codon:yes gene_type:complete